MAEFENEIIPKITALLPNWKHSVDETLSFIEEEQIFNALNILIAYHPDI